MNADLKRVRDNALDDSPSPSAKRRVLGNASPPVADSDGDGIEDWQRVVEVKRKEAIYRQMLEYRRASEREARRANDLENQRRVLEASFHAVEVCWSQVVSAIRDLAGQQEVGLKEEEVLEPVLDSQIAQPELEKALQARLPSTRQLVSRFVGLTAKNGQRPTSNEDLQKRCLKLEAEASSLRSTSVLLQSQVSTLTESRDTLQRDLNKAQKAIDRQRMEHDKAAQEWKEDTARTRSVGTPGAGPSRPNGSGHATPNGKVEDDIKPFGNGSGPSVAGVLQDTSELEQLAESRSKQIQALRADQAHLQQELDRLKLLANHPSETALRDSPFFQVYLNQLATQINRVNSLQTRFDATEKSLDTLRGTNQEFRDAVLAESKAETDGLRAQISKKDSDLARLRGQRDEMNAELMERRAREADKLKFAEQVESLANSRQERIIYLTSEVRRLKGKLAADQSAEGYLSFLKEGGVDGDYIKSLEENIATAQDQITALTTQLRRVSESAAAAAEIESRTELEGAKRALARYERVLGPNPEAAEDVKELARKLETAEKERKGLELKLSEAEAATNALYTEVEGLSKSWETLDHTVHSKVFELKDGELRISRLTTEKAKADNKFFSAMRAKEAVEAEWKLAQRTVEKQLKLLERAQEVEQHLRAQIAANEKGMTSLKNSALELQTQLASTTAEKTQLELRLQHSQAALADAQQVMHQRVAEATSEKAARAKLQDEVEMSTKTIKKLRERQEAMATASQANDMSAGEWQMKEERDKLLKLLRCSCCEQNFKQQVIVKCMHTFCKSCLEARIASRQRKCPACGLAFAKEDIQTLYWQ
ncbi:E3 ubiquitin-protein ligase BRE1 [Kwoniella heveanensis BCC8398]|uniref:E3 ubiquitin protein ligase n=1 Tax=Kwoniella heveanensis BCC8398 TaxID=1296120 RepID=A0A1B9H484_9TREE|nr:E3 ubiquitin-protein ligase BRE1 [Kwoniella heveanensis BCC8398]